MNATTLSLALPSSARPSRRIATRRDVVVPCQAVRERDFKLLADRTLDVSVDGLLLPVCESAVTGERLIVSFPIPGMWIDTECSVTRVVRGRRPGDGGALAIGVLFAVIAPTARAALAGFLHGKPPPLPRRGPLARMRRGQDGPQLADQAIMNQRLVGPGPLASLEDVEEVPEEEEEDRIDPVGLLRDLASAWKRLTLEH